MNYLILFYSNHFAIWTKQCLTDHGILCYMKAVPRHLSSDCGYCIEVEHHDEAQIKTILLENGIEYQEIIECEK